MRDIDGENIRITVDMDVTHFEKFREWERGRNEEVYTLKKELHMAKRQAAIFGKHIIKATTEPLPRMDTDEAKQIAAEATVYVNAYLSKYEDL